MSVNQNPAQSTAANSELPDVKSYSSVSAATQVKIMEHCLFLKSSEKKQTGVRAAVNEAVVCVAGLGDCGINLMARFSNNIHRVIAVDSSKEIVNSILNNQLSRISEPHRSDISKARSGKLVSATTDLITAVKCSDITCITKPFFSNGLKREQEKLQMGSVLTSVGIGLKSQKKFHTVLFFGEPHFLLAEKYYITILEKISGKKCGKDFGVCGILERDADKHSKLSAYIRVLDRNSELIVRRLYKNIEMATCYFDYQAG